jgi:tripartite-type tricarboxylate transporter receptor subunit TctC/citrate lyase beta subunit
MNPPIPSPPTAPPLLRSKLFVPGSRPELFAKALASEADALSFDLEDAVPEARKAEAREAVATLLRSEAAAACGKTLIVRINAWSSPHAAADLLAVAVPGLHLVNLPKPASVQEVVAVAQALEAAERAHAVTAPIGLLLNIESPKALRLAHELAAAHPRVAGLQLGLGDLFEPLAIHRRDSAAVAQAMLTLRLAAGEAGVWACDSAFADVADGEGYRAEALMARRYGYIGKSCIHPRQVPLANAVFRPTDDEIAHAQAVLVAADDASRRGLGAYVVDGRMIDPPFEQRARSTVATALRLGLLAAGTCLAMGSAAQVPDKYPSKPITIVVPYPPGGSNDVFARQVGRGLGAALKTSVVIDNRPGASGNTGTAAVAKAAPDGYTLVAVSSSMVTNAAIQANLPFDPVGSFSPVAMFAKGPFIVAVNNNFPAQTPAQLMSLLKANPGRYNYASSGQGSSNQFATEMLKAMSGTFVVHVPYRGMGPAVTDLIGEQVQMLIASGPSLLPQIRAGRIRAVGITSLTPSAIAPDLPPMAGAVPGYEFELWWGLLAPAGTPPEVVARLNAEVNKLITAPELKEYFLKEGATVQPSTPAQFAATIAADIVRWKQVAARQSIKPE